MFSLPSYISKTYFNNRQSAIAAFVAQPHSAQANVLQHLVASAQHTQWGQQHDFASIKSYQKFQEKVALQDYASLKPFFERMQKGEPDVLWNGKINWFSKSSGTTGEVSKFIPVSYEGLHQSHIKTGKDFLSTYLHLFPQSKFFEGKGLVMGGSYQANELSQDVFAGDISAILMQNLETWIQYFRTPGLKTALIKNWEEKLDAMATITMHQNITNISGVPSWTLLLLQRVLEKTKAKTISEVWPSLQMFAHGGVSLLPYRNAFEEIIGSPIHYQNVYNASEGFFAFQDSLDDDALLLHTNNGVYYEFIPFPFQSNKLAAIPLEEVKPGVNYALVITTNSGLWRYVIGDTIAFVSTNPYRLHITGRTSHFINVFGEEVTVGNTDKALQLVSEKMNIKVHEYTVAPIFSVENKPGKHEWLLEFEQPPTELLLFQKLLDETLQQLNSDYAAKRFQNLVMEELVVKVAASGTFFRWLKANDKLGAQQKIPRLSNQRNFLNQLT